MQDIYPKTHNSITIKDGWLANAKRVLSPNFDNRPDETSLDLIVIHNISLPPGHFGGGYVQQFFCNILDCKVHPFFDKLKGLRVSSHLLIDRQGKVTQFVPFHKRAWHAGASTFNGRSACNDFAIGIELEGADDQPYSDEQYRALTDITNTLFAHYPNLSKNTIKGHNDIAPGRKTDPGEAFDWIRYRSSLQ